MGTAGKTKLFNLKATISPSDVVLNTVTVIIAITIGLPCYLGGWYVDCTCQLLSSLLKKDRSQVKALRNTENAITQ